jgi:glutamate-1-semialdehyde 2,1-aminomutase
MSLPPTSGRIGTHPAAELPASVKTPRNPDAPFDPLYAALSAAQARYTVANPGSLEAHTLACNDFPGGNTRTVLYSSPFPITFGQDYLKTFMTGCADSFKSER